MEQIRIDRGQRGTLARRRREAADAAASTPLDYVSGAGPDLDEDLLARIDEILATVDEGAET